MTVYFYKEDKVFELISLIKYKRNIDGEIHFYYENEVLRSKAKSNITSKNNIFDFTNKINYKEIKRNKMSKESLKVLKYDDSIVITETRDSGVTINTMLEDVKDKINYVQGIVNENILIINCIKKYKELHSKKDEYCLFDLLE